MKILVTPRSITRDGHPSLEKLRTAGCKVLFCRPGVQPDEEELCALLPGCAGYLAGVEPVTDRVLAAATELRAISRNGTGVDNIDLTAAAARGIAVLRAQGANARGVAELTLACVLALARGMVPASAALKSGSWNRGEAGSEIEGRTLGLIGCGRVGRLVARMALGCDARVLAVDPAPDISFAPGGSFRFAGLDEVLASSDFLSLHCPPGADDRPVLDAAAVSRMKPGAFLINTSRYDAFDPAAVLAALDSGHLAGLALDVFDVEPPEDLRLVQHPRTLATPHLGAYTRESIDRAMDAAVENLLAALRPANS
jgi:D-3-phosphoglycerate dehydrogenase